MEASALSPLRDLPALPQHPRFAWALALLGQEPLRAATRDGPVLLTRRRIGPLRLVAALRAPCLSPDGWRDLRRQGLRLSEPDDSAALRQSGFRPVAAPRQVAELDLDGDEAARRARMSGKWRNRLRRAEALGQTVRDAPFTGTLADWLLAREAEQRRQRGYHALHPDFVRAFAACHRDAARVFYTGAGSRPRAAMLVLIHGAVATYHIGWCGSDARRDCDHNLILHHMAGQLADQGVRRLDLGAADPANAGLVHFKTGSGARLRRLGGSWIAIPGL